MKLSIVIPARNEEASVADTLRDLVRTLNDERIPYEILVVDDGSTDGTEETARTAVPRDTGVKLVCNSGPHGFGMAVRMGIEQATGDAVAVMMADGSDSPRDLARYYFKILEGYDCVFGSRFIAGGQAVDYPAFKLAINRLANWFIMALFGIRYNDVTNAFKCYRREAIDGIQPLISPHFNLTVEMPLKAMIRGYSYAVVPITWTNRKTGLSKLTLHEMGSRYLFIVLYLWLEKVLSRGDYRRRKTPLARTAGSRDI